jgi:hypothetical protein
VHPALTVSAWLPLSREEQLAAMLEALETVAARQQKE